MRSIRALAFVAFPCAVALAGCGTCDTASRGPGPSDAAACPHGIVTTRADYEMLVYQLDGMCPTEPRRSFGNAAQFVGAVCTVGGSGFEAGKCGIPRDLERARLYYRRGCGVGYAPACNAAQRLGG